MYSDRVVDILQYVDENPLNVKSQKMYYEHTSKLDSSRLPDVVENLDKQDIFVERHSNDDGRINKNPISKKEEHMADVTTAMLYLACGGMDEAHNLVLPYSWPEYQHMSNGPPILNSPAIKESEYCHAMVHRKEGEIFGELGMVGFNNCKFWFGKTGFHPLYSLVKDETLRIAAAGDYSEHPVLKIFSNDLTKNKWDPETFSDLCANALEMKDMQLLQFCDKVTQFEWKLLLDHCNAIVNPNQSGRL